MLSSDPTQVNPSIPSSENSSIKSPTTVVQHKAFSGKVLKLVIGVFFLLLLTVSASTYTFYIRPSLATTNYINELKPPLASLKNSTSSVRAVMDKINFVVTEELKPTNSKPLETSDVLISPNIASLLVTTNVLGTSTTSGSGLIELAVNQFSVDISELIKALSKKQENIAGIQTASENASVEKLRSLKDETVKANEYIVKAQEDLGKLVQKSSSLPTGTSASLKLLSAESSKIENRANPYFSEAKKIADYYNTISDVTITMNTKISSFRVSLASAGSFFSSLPESTKASELASASAKIDQAQVFLEQAKIDTDEIKKLTETLTEMQENSLPSASSDYHKHNIKVLSTVTEYFTTASNIIGGFITASDVTIAKAQRNELTSGDMRNLRVVFYTGLNEANIADAKFISNLQSLLGEEMTLTISFWQNNKIISTGPLVEADIDNFDKMLNKIFADNTVPLLTK